MGIVRQEQTGRAYAELASRPSSPNGGEGAQRRMLRVAVTRAQAARLTMPRETTTSCGRYESRIHRRVTGWFYQQLRLAVRSPRERPSRWPLAALSSNSGSGNDSIETRPAWISRVGHATLRGIASRSLVRSQRGPPTLQIRASTCQQFQDVVGQAGHAEAVRLSPGPSSPARPGRAVPARSPRQDDRLGEVVVVRVAGCRRDLRDAVRVRFGDLPSRPTLLHVSEELARRDAGHETSGAAVHVIRSHGHCRAPAKQGGGRC